GLAWRGAQGSGEAGYGGLVLVLLHLFSAAAQVGESLDPHQRHGPADLALALRPLAGAEARADEAVHAPLDVALQVGDGDLGLVVAGCLAPQRLDAVLQEHA